jgi:hypothetical protein
MCGVIAAFSDCDSGINSMSLDINIGKISMRINQPGGKMPVIEFAI